MGKFHMYLNLESSGFQELIHHAHPYNITPGNCPQSFAQLTGVMLQVADVVKLQLLLVEWDPVKS